MKNNFEGLSVETIRTALYYLDYEDSEQWLRSGMALYSELGEEGFDLWNAWSSLGSTYDRKNIKARWRTFRKGSGGRPVTIASLIYHAMNAGFKFDETKKEVSPHIIQQRAERRKQLELEAQEEQKKVIQGYASAKNQAQQKWAQAKECSEHPYLTKKDVMPHNTRIGKWVYRDDEGNLQTEENALLVPLYKAGQLVSMQGILPSGAKKLLYKGEKQGVYHDFGELTHTILICEGWATGATLHEATQLYTLAAIDAGNLIHVAKYIRKTYPLHRIIICADNDQYKKSNTGLKAAYATSCAVDADVVYPIFADVSGKPTDFNDLYFEGGYNAVFERVVKPTLYYARESGTDAFNAFDLPYIDDAEKVLEESNAPLDIARAALVVAVRMSEKVPAFMNIETIRKFIAHPLLNPRTHTSIMCRVQWAIQNRKRMATTALRPQSWGKHEHVVVESLEEFVPTNPVSLVFAPMGSGKTRNVITPFSKIPDKTFGAIAHRRSLIADLSGKLGIDNYDDMTAAKADVSERMAICLPSIKSMQLQNFVGRIQNLAIDEISQNIRFTSSKECKVAGANQESVFLGLKQLVNESERVIVADASIDQTTLDFMQEARPDEVFTIVEQIPRNANRKCFLYGDRADLLTQVTIELQNGGNVWFSVESAERAEVLKQMFADDYDVLTITSKNSKTKQIKHFLENIEVESRKYRMVIASPAISSGVSVEHQKPLLDEKGQQVYDEKGKPVFVPDPHFTMIAGMASGHSICFSDFAQMLGRVRYVPHYHVCLQANNKRYEHVNAQSILLGLRQAAALEGAVLKENEYSKFKAHIEATEEMYRADFANGFVWFLEYYCFEMMQAMVANVDYSLSDKMKLLTQELKATYRANIRSADKISTDKAREIEAKQNTTDEEEIQLVAFKIRSSLGFNLDHEIIDENIDMFENMPTLDRFARLMGYAFDIDDTDNNIALRRFYNAQIAAVGTIFENSDICTTFYGKAECDAIVSRVSDNRNRFLLSSLKLIPSRYGQWREAKNGDLLNMGMPSNTSKSVAQILDKYGLSWKRANKGGERGYRVNMDSWNKMKAYAERRYKKALD